MLAKLPAYGKALLDAADLIEKHGHCKEVLQNHQGHLCLLGAMHTAIFGEPWFPDHDKHSNDKHRTMAMAVKAVKEVIFKEQQDCLFNHRLAGWNNADSRKKSQVVRALREAATVPVSL